MWLNRFPHAPTSSEERKTFEPHRENPRLSGETPHFASRASWPAEDMAWRAEELTRRRAGSNVKSMSAAAKVMLRRA